MAPSARTYLYCTSEDLDALLSEEGKEARVDDDDSANPSTTEDGYITSAITWASERVDFYCWQQYQPAWLAQSWLVNNWAVVLAAHWLSSRRGNPPPGSVTALYEQVLEDLKLVKSGQYQIPNIPTRSTLWPVWSNVRVDQLYRLRKLRVERPISERSTPDYRQNKDWGADYIWEW